MSAQQEAQQEVTITCSIEQARVMSKALEVYMRLGIGQIGIVSELLRDGVIPMKSEEPRIAPPFHVVDDFEVLMNQAKVLLGFSAGASNGIGHRNNDVSTHRAYQMMKNLRHALARHRNPEGGVGVDFGNPNMLNYTGEAPPAVKIEANDVEKSAHAERINELEDDLAALHEMWERNSLGAWADDQQALAEIMRKSNERNSAGR